tara:strand:+ start:29 stop:334 length:306 start_codon:yes stop_codon:yes gene_type:complete
MVTLEKDADTGAYVTRVDDTTTSDIPHALSALPYLGAVPAVPLPVNSTANVHSTLVLASSCSDAPKYGLMSSLLTTSLDCGVIERSLTRTASVADGVGSVP